MKMDINTREIAILIWSAVFALWAASHQSIRASFWNVIRGAANRTIFTFIGFLAAYTIIEVWLLDSVGLWSMELLKTALGWFVLTGLTSGGNALTSYDDPPYGKHVRDSLRVAVILELVMGKFTFSLPVELILVPIVVLVGLLVAVNEMRSKDPLVQRLLIGFQVVVGLLIFAFASARAVREFSVLAKPVVLMEFLLPPILSLLFIPALFLIVLFARYEWLFLKIRGDKKFRRHAKLRLLSVLGPRPRKVLAFGRKHAFVLPSICTRAELEDLIQGRLAVG
jgi:hypothetical protein